MELRHVKGLGGDGDDHDENDHDEDHSVIANPHPHTKKSKSGVSSPSHQPSSSSVPVVNDLRSRLRASVDEAKAETAIVKVRQKEKEVSLP